MKRGHLVIPICHRDQRPADNSLQAQILKKTTPENMSSLLFGTTSILDILGVLQVLKVCLEGEFLGIRVKAMRA